MGSQDRIEADADEKDNYINNQGVFEAIAKGIKVGTFMIRLVIKIESREIREIIMTGAGYLFLLKIVRLLQ